MIQAFDGGGFLTAAIAIFGVLILAVLIGLNVAVNKLRDAFEKMRDEVKSKRIYETDRFVDRNRVSADEILQAADDKRISLGNQFISIDNLTRAFITGKPPDDPILRNETTIADIGTKTIKARTFDGDIVEIENYRPSLEYRDGAGRTLTPIPPDDQTVEPTPKTRSRARKRRKKPQSFEHGQRKPITEILSDIYDTKKTK